MRSAEFWIREHPMVALCLSVTLLTLAVVGREAIDGTGGAILWFVLFVPSVVIGSVLLRVFWEIRRSG